MALGTQSFPRKPSNQQKEKEKKKKKRKEK
jgi:hypothetical protein